MVIAIDGPAGAGKSTVARAVAERLGFTYLDSGAMYRAVALAADGVEADLAAVAEAAGIALGERVELGGRDVTGAIRAPARTEAASRVTADPGGRAAPGSPAVTEAASRVSADPGVRAALVRKQRALLQRGDWVAEGRDIGTVVCPQAEVKVFLTASPEVRARRRAEQIGEDYATV